MGLGLTITFRLAPSECSGGVARFTGESCVQRFSAVGKETESILVTFGLVLGIVISKVLKTACAGRPISMVVSRGFAIPHPLLRQRLWGNAKLT